VIYASHSANAVWRGGWHQLPPTFPRSPGIIPVVLSATSFRALRFVALGIGDYWFRHMVYEIIAASSARFPCFEGFSERSPLCVSRPRRSRGQAADGLSHCVISSQDP
jgi:hypothetical protein